MRSYVWREDRRRQRTRYVILAAIVATAVLVGVVTLPAVLTGERPSVIAPVQTATPPDEADPTPTDDTSLAPTSNVPTPVFENLKADWTRLASPPEPRAGAVTIWSGRQRSGRDLILWGGEFGGTVHNDGFSWDPETNVWSVIATSPLSARSQAGAVFTGAEIVIWGGYGEEQTTLSDGAAYDPKNDRWRMLPTAPIGPAVPVATEWTGQEVLIWGTTERPQGSREGAAYNPATNEWRRLPDAPAAINQGNAVWTRGNPAKPREMIVFGAQLNNNNGSKLDHAIGIAYNPESNSWRELPKVDLSPNASVIAWGDDTAVAWDYGLSAAEYDPASNQWRQLPDVPLRAYECYPATESIGAYVFAWYCGEAALWNFLDEGWQRIDTPDRFIPGMPVAAGEVLLFAGSSKESQYSSLWVYVPPSGRP